MFTQPDTFFSDEVLFISLWRNVVLTDTVGDMTLTHVAQLERAYAEAARLHPTGFVVCSFIGDGVPAMAKEGRDKITNVLRSHEDTLKCVAMVIEEHGLGGRLLRVIIRGINAVTRNNRILVFSNGEIALSELAPFVEGFKEDPRLTEELLRSVVSNMRASYVLQRGYGLGSDDAS